MIKMKDILDEKDKRLRNISKEVTFPLSQKDKDTINFVVVHEVTKEDDEEQKFDTYVIINPVMISHSEEEIAADAGEGCLSVNRDVEGYVKRYARVKFEGYDIDGNKISIRAREELAIAFQHELDHLNGILFIDKITNNNDGIRTI